MENADKIVGALRCCGNTDTKKPDCEHCPLQSTRMCVKVMLECAADLIVHLNDFDQTQSKIALERCQNAETQLAESQQREQAAVDGRNELQKENNALVMLLRQVSCNCAVTYTRLRELAEADEDGRCAILPSGNDAIVHAIEVALKIKLYDWQKAYILGASDYLMPGRVTGRTTAYMLKLLLSKGPPIHLYKTNTLHEICDEYHGTQYYGWFGQNLRNMYLRLSNPEFGLNLRKIYFSEREWLAYRRKTESCNGIDLASGPDSTVCCSKPEADNGE